MKKKRKVENLEIDSALDLTEISLRIKSKDMADIQALSQLTGLIPKAIIRQLIYVGLDKVKQTITVVNNKEKV